MKENNFPFEGISFHVVILNFLQCASVRNLAFSASQNFNTKVFVPSKWLLSAQNKLRAARSILRQIRVEKAATKFTVLSLYLFRRRGEN